MSGPFSSGSSRLRGLGAPRPRGVRSRGLVLAALAALWLAGCAGGATTRPPRVPVDPRTPASLPAPAEVPLAQRAYAAGYTDGWRDREAGASPDHTRHATPYHRSSGREFRAGYADGYQRRSHRYGGGPE